MNSAHIHLILNHIPIIGIPIALAFLLYGIWTDNKSSRRFSLLILSILAVAALPVYLTGEPAEEVVEHLPGVAESFIEAHEEAGKVSLILTLITGGASLLALWFQNNQKKARLISFGVIGIASASIVSLLYTANLGGQIRHTEFRSENAAQSHDSEGNND
jgi:uncharacterized membrane protein